VRRRSGIAASGGLPARQLHVLHPDELHDGAAATSEGFRYRIAYVAPDLIRGALDDRALPFVQDPIQDQNARSGASSRRAAERHRSAAERCGASRGGGRSGRPAGSPQRTVRAPSDPDAIAGQSPRWRDYLDAHIGMPTPLRTLEQVAGLDRFTLARQFPRAYGTSPDR